NRFGFSDLALDRLCPVPISSVRYWLRPAPYDARSHRACSSCPGVHSLEPATVDRDHGLGEQVQPSAQHYELAAGRPDRWPLVLAEIGDRLEVGRQPPGQPHQLDIALRFPFEPPARLHAVEIAVEIDLQ